MKNQPTYRILVFGALLAFSTAILSEWRPVAIQIHARTSLIVAGHHTARMIPKKMLLEIENSLPNDLSIVEYVTERGIPIGYLDNYSNFVEFTSESPTTEELHRRYDRVKKTLAITSMIQPTLLVVSLVFVILSYIYGRRASIRQPSVNHTFKQGNP